MLVWFFKSGLIWWIIVISILIVFYTFYLEPNEKIRIWKSIYRTKRKSKFLHGWFEKDLEEVWMSHGDM